MIAGLGTFSGDGDAISDIPKAANTGTVNPGNLIKDSLIM